MSPTFHDRLVTLYLEEASDLSGDDSHRVEVREKMVKFLEESDQYMPERVLGKLSRGNIHCNKLIIGNEFLPERAVVLSKMGQHKNALEIYVFKLKDYTKAETYHIFVQANQATVSASTPKQPQPPPNPSKNQAYKSSTPS